MGNDRDKNNPPLPLMRNETIIEAPVDQSTITQRYTAEAKADIGDYQREGANARPAGWVEKPEFLLVKEN
jgi:hypothetical protein